MLSTTLWMGVDGYGQSSAQLAGSVQDATGLPLAGVTLILHGPSKKLTQTDSEGQFDFQSLPDGQYELTATLPGFAPARQITRLIAPERSVISLTLTVLVLEQTVVTAARTGEADVQTVPMAVSVLPGIQLARMQDHTVEDIAGRAPGVTFAQNTGRAQITIRGIGTNAVAPGSDPSSALYLDGVYLARPAMVLADFLDLDRVEVLRGPQGTLYGRNSLGGAINLVSRTPTSDKEASFRISGGSDGTFRVDARVSGPIIPGRLMGSGAILRGVRTGTVRDLNHPDHPLGGEDVIGARGQLRVVFNQRTELRIAADLTDSDPAPLYYSKILAVKPGFHVDNPADLHDVRASFPAEGSTFQSGASARLTVDLTPSIRATSLTAFRGVDFKSLTDTDISELDLSASRAHETQHQFSEEVTVASRNPRLTWIAGLFLFGEADRQPTSIYAPAARLETRVDPRVEAEASAVFGQATFAVTPRVAVTTGLRYTHERKTIDNAGGNYAIDSPTTLLSGSYSYTDAISDDAWTPKFALEMRARENVMAYASATRGFKSGGFNASSPEAGRGFAPEWAWSYEGRIEDRRRRRTGQAERGGVSHELYRPAGANRDSARRARHLERCGSNYSGSRVGSDDARPRHHPGWGARRLVGRDLRSVSCDRGRRRHRRGRSKAQQLAGMVGTHMDRLDSSDRPGELVVASRRLDVEDDGVLHALQRPHPAAASGWTTGHQRRVQAHTTALVDCRVCAQPHQRELHHRVNRFTSAGLRGPARRRPPVWCAMADGAVMSLRRWLFWMVWLNLAFVSSAAAQPEARQVLLLSSFQREPIAVFNQTFRTELSRQSPEPINFFEVSIRPTPFDLVAS